MSGQGAADGAVTTDDERLIIVEAARAYPSGISSRPATLSGEPILCEGADTLVSAGGHQSVTGLEAELAGWAGQVHVIGDCLAPRTAEEAVLEGLRAGTAI